MVYCFHPLNGDPNVPAVLLTASNITHPRRASLCCHTLTPRSRLKSHIKLVCIAKVWTGRKMENATQALGEHTSPAENRAEHRKEARTLTVLNTATQTKATHLCSCAVTYHVFICKVTSATVKTNDTFK